MAESGEGDMAGSWWGGWLQTAKEKGTAAFEMVRKDLAEFGCTMQQDTGHAIEVTSSTLRESIKTENTGATKEKLTKGLNTFLEGISKALVVPPDDEGQVPIIGPQTDTYDRSKARLHAVQVDPGTYLHEPSGPTETYNMWCEGFDLDTVKGEISDLLVSKAEVRGLYTKLVPSRVSHVDFWRRYFFRLHQIDVDQARKEALMKRAERSRADDSLGWDDDWSGDEMAEDSGSDWEKMPRPNQPQQLQQQQLQQQQQLAPEAGAGSTSAASTTPPASASHTDCHDTRAEVSSAQPSVAAEGEFREVSLEDKKHCRDSEPSVLEERVVVPVPAAGASSVPLASDLPVPARPCAEEEDSPASQSLNKPMREYLELSFSDDEGPEVLGDAVPEKLPSPVVSPATPLPAKEAGAGSADFELPQLLVPDAQQSDGSVASASSTATSSPEIIPAASETVPTPSLQPQEPAASAAPAAEALLVQQALSVAVEEEEENPELKTTTRGDLVVVGSAHGSPLSNTSESKGVSDEESWEQDLDIELTEDDMKAAEELAKKLGENIDLDDDDWESWE